MSHEEKQPPQPNTRLTELNEEQRRGRDFSTEQKKKIIAKGNPPIDNNVIRGYN